ncbi:MAG: putative ferrous iron transport protein [Pseudobdellovibrio sp.]|jgi:Fe2+ transport system protein FeoA|nr:putative ferrous iron transport protein [Pseudobdellovibrio sp.]
MKNVTKYRIQSIATPEGRPDNPDLIQRLYDFGLHPGIEVEVVGKVSFNSVTIIQFGNTRLALNEEEFSCLRGH